MRDLEGRLAEVRQEYIRRMVSGDVELLRKIEEYVVERSGKMLRPRLTLLSAATLGEEVFRTACNGTGKACTLPTLEKNDDCYGKTGENLKNCENDFNG